MLASQAVLPESIATFTVGTLFNMSICCAGQEREQTHNRTSEVVDTKERIVEVTQADPCGGVPTAEYGTGVTGSRGTTGVTGSTGTGITGSRTGTTTGAGYGSGTGTGTNTGYGSGQGRTGSGGNTIT